LLAYFILLIPASTYILFDLRHNFSHVRALFFAPPNQYIEKVDFFVMLMQRISMSTSTGLHFFRDPLTPLNTLLTICISFIAYFTVIKKKEKYYLYSFIYFFIGYFILSLTHNGWVMYFYWMQVYPITFLFFAYSKDILKKEIYFSILFFVILVNTIFNFSNIKKSGIFIDLSQNSWKFQSSMVETIFKEAKDKEFGFFIYAPDIFAYGSKYPFVFMQKKYPTSKPVRYEKRSTTYIVVEPPPKLQPQFIPDWWIENKLHISTSPAQINILSNGFKVLKYELKGDDLSSQIEPGVTDWVYFR
jgi:hypothetical protein